MRGSKRDRRWRRSGPRYCFCWRCLPSKEKLNSIPRKSRERMALRYESDA